MSKRRDNTANTIQLIFMVLALITLMLAFAACFGYIALSDTTLLLMAFFSSFCVGYSLRHLLGLRRDSTDAILSRGSLSGEGK